jgi:hypothetical protein
MIEMGLVSPGNYGIEITNETFPRWKSEYIKFVKGVHPLQTLYVDELIGKQSKYNFGILSEPKSIGTRFPFDQLVENYASTADLAFSYYPELSQQHPNFRKYFGGMMCFIDPAQRSVYPKSKKVSATFSKLQRTDGHRFRQDIRSSFSNDIDFINPPERNQKIIALQEYRYHVIVENEDTHFSEKFLDALLCGCIPIYKGGDVSMFNGTSIMKFSSIQELHHILASISDEHYESVLPAIQQNFEEAKTWTTVGDVLWRSGLGQFFEDKNNE